MSRADELIEGVLEGKSPEDVLVEAKDPKGYIRGLTPVELTMDYDTRVYWGYFDGRKFQYTGIVDKPAPSRNNVWVKPDKYQGLPEVMELHAGNLHVKLPPGMTPDDLGIDMSARIPVPRKPARTLRMSGAGTTQPQWKGFKRSGGRLVGEMPFGFLVKKNDRQLGNAGSRYQRSGPGRMGMVPYFSIESGKTVSLDADEINSYTLKKIIEPY